MKKADFYPEISEGPINGQAYWVTTDDNLTIRVGMWPRNGVTKGSVFLFPGRFGYIERFGRVAAEFERNGFASMVIDWRSQGLSARLTKDRQTGHILRFSDYQKDVEAMFKAAETLDLPRPWNLVAISMGACIGLRSVMDGIPVSAAAFIVPMWGIKLPLIKRLAAWPVTWSAQALGMGHLYAPGEISEPYILSTRFAENNLTHDPEMYDYWINQSRTIPQLSIGGPSFAWVYQSMVECRTLSKFPSPKVPCITFCAEQDDLVDNSATKDRMDRWPGGTFKVVEKAKHDILSEVPEIRSPITKKICQFFAGK
tara:strand:- start:223 stop:1158 length:936 start_codon:yes stop_codon:yes gene_type:complete